VDTSLPPPDDIVEPGTGDHVGQLYDDGPRTLVILERAR
jgi:hypothetical protein